MTNIGSLEVLLKLKDELSSAITKISPTMDAVNMAALKVNTTLEKTSPVMANVGQMTGNAEFRMNRMHAAALEMDNEFGSLNDKAQIMSKNIELAGQTLKGMGEASGISADMLKSFGAAGQGVIAAGNAIGPASAIASVGLDTLKNSAAGLNATTFALIGAAFSLGSAIGGWLNSFKAVRDAADAVTGALYKLFQGQEQVNAQAAATSGISAFSAQMAEKHNEALKKQFENFKSAGTASQEYKNFIAGLTEAQRRMLGVAGEQVVKTKEVAAAQLAAAQAAKAWAAGTHEANVAGHEYILMAEAAAAEAEHEAIVREVALQELLAGEEALANAIEVSTRAVAAAAAADEEYEAILREMGLQAAEAAEQMQHFADVADLGRNIFGVLSGVLDAFGVTMGDTASVIAEGAAQLLEFDYAAARAQTGMQKAQGIVNGVGEAFQAGAKASSKMGAAMGGAVAGVKAGAAFGPIGMAVGAVAGAVVGLIGKWRAMQKIIMKINDERDAFFAGFGGFEAMGAALGAVGVSAERAGDLTRALFDANTPEKYKKAVEDVNLALKAGEDATVAVRDAMERYGLTVDQMGTRFAQQELDIQAQQLLQDYAVLIAAGADMNVVLSAMAPAMNDYIAAAMTSGATIPEAMRAQIQALFEAGQLVHENGEAFTQAEVDGLNFAETVSEAIGRAADAIERLVAALTGVSNVAVPPIHIPVVYDDPGRPGGGPPIPGAEGPGIPGFSHGSGGFQDFGAGTTAVLHGTEAVVTPSQAAAMSGGGGMSSAQLDQIVAALVRGVRDGVLLAQR